MWNERYADAFSAYGDQPNNFLKEVAPRLQEGPVLCLAEGEGRNAVFLAQQGHAVTAVDQSDVGLRNAEQLAEKCAVSLTTVVADLADYSLGEARWGAIVSIWAHLPAGLRQRVHRACVRALKPGGALVLEAYTPQHLEMPGIGGPPDAIMLMTAEGLKAELAGLHFEVCVERDREIQEGKYHQGLSNTVQLLAFKPEA